MTPAADTAWARPSSTVTVGTGFTPSPAVTPPPTHQAQPPGWRRGVWIMIGAAVVLGIAAVAMSVITATRPTPPTVTTTVTTPAPSFSADQIAASKKETCSASLSVDAPLGGTQRELAAAQADRSAPAYASALSTFQTTLAVETQYMRIHITPSTPEDVSHPTHQYIDAWIALGDAYTRGLPDDQIQPILGEVSQWRDRLNEVCG